MRALILALCLSGCASGRLAQSLAITPPQLPATAPARYLDFATASEAQLRAHCEAYRETGDERYILADFGDGLIGRLNCDEQVALERDCEGVI